MTYFIHSFSVNQYRGGRKRSSLNVRNRGCAGVHGKRESERRKRQITSGSLKEANGLVNERNTKN